LIWLSKGIKLKILLMGQEIKLWTGYFSVVYDYVSNY
jgi:hypothetical protein